MTKEIFYCLTINTIRFYQFKIKELILIWFVKNNYTTTKVYWNYNKLRKTIISL